MRAGYPSEHLIVLVLTLPKRSTAFTCRYTEHSSSQLVYGKTDAKAIFYELGPNGTRFVKSPVTDLYYLLSLEKIMGYDLNRGENVTS